MSARWRSNLKTFKSGDDSRMIISTAGHVDHGKTALVHALTGIDTDSLAEEKRRGISIDLGFAYRDVGDDKTIGFVDVPGHERFVRTMVAGLAGIDFALIVVAADDGVMPQTREHIEIINLIGIGDGAVAITKSDLVDEARLDEVHTEILDLLDETPLSGARFFNVSSRTGVGIEALDRHLIEQSQKVGKRTTDAKFRLAIDRVFTLPGIGVVVTGPIVAGSVAPGDNLVIAPAGIAARVRSLQIAKGSTLSAAVGDRCAINITGRGVETSAIRRGDWLVDADHSEPVSRIDARLNVVMSEDKVLSNWAPVHVHIGSGDVPARVAVLEGASIAPGSSGLVRLALSRPVAALYGDHVIIRDQSAKRTIAGGRIIDPFAPKRGRARPDRLAVLRALEHADHLEALQNLLEVSPFGIDLSLFTQARNLGQSTMGILTDKLNIVRVGDDVISVVHFSELQDLVTQVLGEFHTSMPDRFGLDFNKLLRIIEPRHSLSFALMRRATDDLQERALIAIRGSECALSGFVPCLKPHDAKTWAKIEPHLIATPPVSPVVHELAKFTGLEVKVISSTLQHAEAIGHVKRTSRNRFVPSQFIEDLLKIVIKLSGEGRLSAGEFRTDSHIGRNYAIEILEYFDRIGVTVRRGDIREVVVDNVSVAEFRRA
jgi:selenocysteine-specific elongation factor